MAVSSMINVMGKSASLWYAYNALKEQGKGTIAAGQLKVFTHNLATSLGLADADCQQLLSTIGTSTALDDYLTFLSGSLFATLQPALKSPSSSSSSVNTNGRKSLTGRELLDKVDEVCWMICAKSFTSATQTMKEKDLYKLWRIFTVLAERSPQNQNEVDFPVAIHVEEVDVFVQQLSSMLKIPCSVSSPGPQVDVFSFTHFLEIVERRCLIGREQHVISAAVDELYGEIVANVLKKGYLTRSQKGSVTAGVEQLWYVLTPSCLRFYTRRDEQETRGEIMLSKSCRVESLPDKAGIGFGNIGVGSKVNRFAIHMTEALGGNSAKTIELCAPDVQTKFEWIQVIQQAIDGEGQAGSGHTVALERRRHLRAERRARQLEEEERKMTESNKMAATLMQLEAERKAREEAEAKLLTDAENLRRELCASAKAKQDYEAEHMARIEAEMRLREEERLREQEQRQLRELKERYLEMENLLEEERRAKNDEEIVRNLQARILQEEFEKREQLEELKAELERMLAQEQEKSTELQDYRQRQEELYVAEQIRLENLIVERQKRDQQYEAAVAKLRDAEQARDKLRIELDRRESDLRRERGLGFRFRQITPGNPNPSSSASCPLSAPIMGACTDAPLRRAHWISTSQSSTDSPFNSTAQADDGSSAVRVTSPDAVACTAPASGRLLLTPTSPTGTKPPPPVAPKRRSKCSSERSGCSSLEDPQLPVVRETDAAAAATAAADDCNCAKSGAQGCDLDDSAHTTMTSSTVGTTDGSDNDVH